MTPDYWEIYTLVDEAICASDDRLEQTRYAADGIMHYLGFSEVVEYERTCEKAFEILWAGGPLPDAGAYDRVRAAIKSGRLKVVDPDE